MANSVYLPLLQSCLSFLSDSLALEESVLRVEQGQMRYGRQTFAFYKVRIGTFKGATGNEPVDIRTVVVEVNVDPPFHARAVDDSNWLPLPE